jgi:multidrug efflux pump
VTAILPMLYLFSTKELAPREDQGIVFGIIQSAPNSSIEQTLLYTDQVYKIFAAVPEYQRTFQLTNPNGGFSGILLKPWSERSRTAQEIEGQLWGAMSSIAGVRVIVATPPPLPGGSDFAVEFVISSTAEPERIATYADQIVARAFASGVFMYADSDLKFDLPQSEIVLDRDKLAAIGLDQAQVGEDLGVYLGGNYVNRFSIMGRSYKVIPQALRAMRLTPDDLLNLYVSGADQKMIPLSTIATIKNRVVPRQINRFQQLNSAKIQGAIPPGITVDQGLQVLETAAEEILPRDYVVDYAGESRQLRREGDSLTMTLLMALVVIFLVLASQFESFRDPLIILLGTVPLALAGALLFTFLGVTTLNVYSQVGLVTLVGLIAKNGILIVEFANSLQEQGRSKLDAVEEAATTRLRPIMMTSVATIVGHFPLVIASGAGAGARNSIGIMLVGGMVIGTIFTLFLAPVFYMFIAKEHKVHQEESKVFLTNLKLSVNAN